MNRSPSFPAHPPDPACPICSKPVQSGILVWFEHGEAVHVRCRSKVLQRTALHAVDRSQMAQQRAAQLVDEVTTRRSRRLRPRPRLCPVCMRASIVTDWGEWSFVEGCPCGGFFASTMLLSERLPQFTAEERSTLVSRIQSFRVVGHEAWVTTMDGTPTGL